MIVVSDTSPLNYLLQQGVKARRIAKHRFNLRVTGTLGVLILAHLAGLLNAYEAFAKLRKETNFYCTPQVEKTFLASLSELI